MRHFSHGTRTVENGGNGCPWSLALYKSQGDATRSEMLGPAWWIVGTHFHRCPCTSYVE